jgi:hypothetical protein
MEENELKEFADHWEREPLKHVPIKSNRCVVISHGLDLPTGMNHFGLPDLFGLTDTILAMITASMKSTPNLSRKEAGLLQAGRLGLPDHSRDNTSSCLRMP